MCQNEGTLNNGTCMCNCADGFSGANCESECIVRRGKSPGAECQGKKANLWVLQLTYFMHRLKCIRAHLCGTTIPVFCSGNGFTTQNTE